MKRALLLAALALGCSKSEAPPPPAPAVSTGISPMSAPPGTATPLATAAPEVLDTPQPDDELERSNVQISKENYKKELEALEKENLDDDLK